MEFQKAVSVKTMIAKSMAKMAVKTGTHLTERAENLVNGLCL
jgi:hypothetical protein